MSLARQHRIRTRALETASPLSLRFPSIESCREAPNGYEHEFGKCVAASDAYGTAVFSPIQRNSRLIRKARQTDSLCHGRQLRQALHLDSHRTRCNDRFSSGHTNDTPTAFPLVVPCVLSVSACYFVFEAAGISLYAALEKNARPSLLQSSGAYECRTAAMLGRYRTE